MMLEPSNLLLNLDPHCIQEPRAGRIHGTGEHQILPDQYAQLVGYLHTDQFNQLLLRR